MFKEELKKMAEEKYPYKFEFHAHTSPASRCADHSSEEVVTAFHNAGYSGIAITNHFYLKDEPTADFLNRYRKDYLEAVECGEKLGMKVYLGAELRFKNENDNDYLFYGFDISQLEEMYSLLDGTLANFVEKFKTDDMFIVQAHPFRDDMVQGYEEYLDAVEGFNMHPNHNSRVALAVKRADAHNKIITAGTDFHHMKHVGICATRAAYVPENVQELIKLYRSKDFVFEISGKIVL